MMIQFEMGNYAEAEELLITAEEKSAIVEGNDTTRAVILNTLHCCMSIKEYDKAFFYLNFTNRKLGIRNKIF